MGTTYSRGFTLMELLIVIAIIGILVSIATASYTTAQKKTRDSRRVSDMKSVQNAWEQYFAANSASYPVPCTVSATYLPGGFPVDPKSGVAYPTMYSGWSQCAATSYCFCAGLETTTSSNASGGCDSVATPGYNGFYCVRNLQ